MSDYRFKIGDKVQYRPAWGSGDPVEATIQDKGYKNGKPLYDYDNGHWGYDENVDKLVSTIEVVSLFKDAATPEITLDKKAAFLDRFNLNWKVEKRPLYTIDAGGQDAIKLKQRALVRTDTDAVLNVVTDRYVPIQNERFFSLLNDAEEKGLINGLRGGVFSGGGKTWMQAGFGESKSIGKGDEIKSRILLANSHDGSFSFRSTLSPIRVICMNTLSAAMNDGARLAFRHTESSQDRLDQLKVALDKMKFDFDKVAAFYQSFADQQITSESLRIYFKSVLTITNSDDDMTENEEDKMSRLISLFENGTGQELNRGSIWSAYNAVTEYTSHKIGKQERREESLHFGKGAELNRKALSEALKLVS